MLKNRANPRKAIRFPDVYYGWIIVAVGLVSMAFWIGIRSSFSVFYVALLEEFQWNRGDSAGVLSMALITYMVMSPIVGGLIDRVGPRKVIVPGVLLLILGLALCATVNSLKQFYLLYGVVMGAGVTAVSIVPYSAIIAHWFDKKKGLASGIAVSGMGLGTFLLVPLSQQWINWWGWRVSFLITAGLVFVLVLPLNALLLRHKPAEVGQRIDGQKNTDEQESQSSPGNTSRIPNVDWTIKKVLLSPRFWAVIGFVFFSIIGIWIMVVHNVRFMVDQGIEPMQAAFIFAMVGVVSLIFRIVWGWLSDHIGREVAFTLGALCVCLAAGSLILLETSGIKAIAYVFLILFGMGWAVTAPLFIAVAADLYKGKIFGLIYGMLECSVGIAGAFGAWVAGHLFDKYQSYQTAWVLAIITMLLSCMFLWIAAPRKTRLQQ